jgi:hypothetical protein
LVRDVLGGRSGGVEWRVGWLLAPEWEVSEAPDGSFHARHPNGLRVIFRFDGVGTVVHGRRAYHPKVGLRLEGAHLQCIVPVGADGATVITAIDTDPPT